MSLQWLSIRLLGLFAGPVEFLSALLERIRYGDIASKPYLNLFEKVNAIDGVETPILVIESLIYIVCIFVICLIIGIFIKKEDLYFKKSLHLFGWVLFVLGGLGLVSRVFTWITITFVYKQNILRPYTLDALSVSFKRDIVFLVLGLFFILVFNENKYRYYDM